MARSGDADVLFVHHKPSEEKIRCRRHGRETLRRHVQRLCDGRARPSDPAGIKGSKTAEAALKKLAAAKAPFASRGDDSGTNKKELGLWKAAGIDPKTSSGTWYRETGSGMGATLNVASGMNTFALTDRATWLKFKNKGDLAILVEGDPKLFNQYGIILVSAEKHPHTKTALGQKFIDWIIGAEGQTEISKYQILGNQAFFANAKPGS